MENQLRGRDIPPCLDSLGLERPKKPHHTAWFYCASARQAKTLMRICFKVIGYMLGNKAHKRKCKHRFSSLDFKNWIFISSVLQFTSFKSHGEKVKKAFKSYLFPFPKPGVPAWKSQPKEQPGQAQEDGRRQEFTQWGTYSSSSSVKSTGFCLSQFSGCLRDPGLPISSLFWHIYIGSGSSQCVTSGMSRWNPSLPVLQPQTLQATQSSLI